MTEFAYNNSKNAGTGYTPFELNCGYHLWVFFKDKCDARSKSSIANGLAMELRELINVCRQKLLYTQDFQKQAHDKGVKSCSYASGEKVWLNSQYIKIKWKQKLKAKFFRLFQIFHQVRKEAYKLKLPAK